MAEIFGVIAGAAGLLDVSFRLAKGLRSLKAELKNAPDLIQALTNEVEDIGAVLASVEETGKVVRASGIGTPSSTAIFEQLQVQLDKAGVILNELEGLIQSFEAETPLRRRFMWVRKQSQILDLQSKLQEVRKKIQELLATYTW